MNKLNAELQSVSCEIVVDTKGPEPAKMCGKRPVLYDYCGMAVCESCGEELATSGYAGPGELKDWGETEAARSNAEFLESLRHGK